MLIKLPLEIVNYGTGTSSFKDCLFDTTAIVTVQNDNYDILDTPQLFTKQTLLNKEFYTHFSDATFKTVVRTKILAIDGQVYITHLSVEEVEALIKGAA